MKNLRKHLCFSNFLLLLVISDHRRTSVLAQEAENEREFDYKQGSGKGPGHWGELKKDWAACKNGSMQSPIDLSSERVKAMPKLIELKRNYKASHGTLKNRGHDISLYWNGDAGSIEIDGSSYYLQQLHWHSPSEHSINGRRYDLELHLVHVNRDPTVKSNITVVGLLYKLGHPDHFLSKLTKFMRELSDGKEEKEVGLMDPAEIKIDGKKYYRYMGSLTIPPCTEGVIWTISKRTRTVSREQVQLLRQVVHDYAQMNSRPLQPLNSREIQSYGTNPRQIND